MTRVWVDPGLLSQVIGRLDAAIVKNGQFDTVYTIR